MKNNILHFSTFVITCAMFLLSSIASGAYSTRSLNTTITLIQPYPEGVYIKLANNIHDTESCGKQGAVFLDKNHVNYNVVSAGLMTAFTTGETVSLYMKGCLNGYTKIYGVSLTK